VVIDEEGERVKHFVFQSLC